jgi:hypothetical protein
MIIRLGSRIRAFLVLMYTIPLGAQGQAPPTQPAFRFSREAGIALSELWRVSQAAKEERVACLASTIRNDTVFVTQAQALEPEEADSMGISARASVEECGPPHWSGTVHTHVALYTDDLPSTKFSAQDRTAMRLWYARWHTDGVFCVVYSREDAHCEADGVVGGMRTKPRLVK